MTMAMTAAQLRTVRDEVGDDPDDDALNVLFNEVGSTTAVALAILRPRLANALTAAAAGSFTLAGVLTAGAPAEPRLLAQQVTRLEGQLAAETGDVDTSGLAASSVIAGRRDRYR